MITHKSLEGLCDRFMNKRGWYKIIKPRKLGSHVADRIYTLGENSVPLVFELKPENCTDSEIQKGLGQCVSYLPWQVKPYLVISQSWADEFQPVFDLLPFLGILQYTEEGKFLIRQKASERDWLSFPPLETLLVEAGLTKAMVWDFIKKTYPDGNGKAIYVALDEIMERLHEAYPLITIYRPVVAKLLLSMGFGRQQRNPVTLDSQPKLLWISKAGRRLSTGADTSKLFFTIKYDLSFENFL